MSAKPVDDFAEDFSSNRKVSDSRKFRNASYKFDLLGQILFVYLMPDLFVHVFNKERNADENGDSVFRQIFRNIFQAVAEHAACPGSHKYQNSNQTETVVQWQERHVYIPRIKSLITLHIPDVAHNVLVTEHYGLRH